MQDEIVTVLILGKHLQEVLENSLAALPKHDGCYPCISGMRVKYDSSKPSNERVLEVTVNGEPLNDKKSYTCVTKGYIYQGKDGFKAFPQAELISDEEENPTLDTLVINFLSLLTTKNNKWYSPDKKKLMAGLKRVHNKNMENLSLDHEGKEMPYKYYKIFPKIDGRLTDVSKE